MTERTISPALRFLLVPALLVIILAGMRAAAPVLGPLMLVFFFAILCAPLHARLLRRGVPRALAHALMALFLVGLVLGLIIIVGASAAEFVHDAERYQRLLVHELQGIRRLLERAGLPMPARSLSHLVSGEALLGPVVLVVRTLSELVVDLLYVVVGVVFLLADGPVLMKRLGGRLGAGHPMIARLESFGRGTVRYFTLRTWGNALTAAGATLVLLLLGIDLALLWGILTFFLSYVPYVGAFLSAVPPVILGLATHGPAHALLVAAGILTVNSLIEHFLMPRLLSRHFSLPIFVVFVSFFFWTWLLGPPGALLAMPLTQFVVLLLDSFDETRWIGRLLSSPDK